MLLAPPFSFPSSHFLLQSYAFSFLHTRPLPSTLPPILFLYTLGRLPAHVYIFGPIRPNVLIAPS